MHKFLRSVGFRSLADRKTEEEILQEISVSSDFRNAVRLPNGNAFVEYVKEFAPRCGIVVCGEMDGQGFHRDYYFPYFRTDVLSTLEEIEVERKAQAHAFIGVCEEPRIGTSLMFYLTNAAQYQKETEDFSVQKRTSLSLCALAANGTVLLPVQKKKDQILHDLELCGTRSHLIAAAKNGDEKAMETLTMEDINAYNTAYQRVQNEDVYSIVDTFFMPNGVECDHYQIMGEILSCTRVRNKRTKEYLYQMSLFCNNTKMSVCINAEDLYGEPMAGRRFKGEVWMQGTVRFKQKEKESAQTQ